jgi:pyrroloquinoline quinone biosynthesis protein E
MEKAGSARADDAPAEMAGPRWLNAEITYKCPLHCVFCYNPIDYTRFGPEIATEDWLRAFRQARELGAVQLGISGGEPLMRDDAEVLATEATKMGYYVNLITSGSGSTKSASRSSRRAGSARSSSPSRIRRVS